MNFEDNFIGRPNTVATYRSLFKHHIKSAQIEKIIPHWNDRYTRKMVLKWNDHKNLSPRTCKILLRLLRDYIIFMGGPVIEIKQYTRIIETMEQQEELHVLNKEEAATLMEKCKITDPDYYPILLLGLHAGLRRGEIFGLRCGDVDLFKNRIRIARSYNGPTKNGKTRYVPMSKELEKVMVGARNLLMRPGDERIFEVMNPNPKLRKICRYANIQKMRFHDLRHTFATMALENGISPRQVANWLGHSNVHTTLSIYWNLTKDEADVNSFLPGEISNVAV